MPWYCIANRKIIKNRRIGGSFSKDGLHLQEEEKWCLTNDFISRLNILHDDYPTFVYTMRSVYIIANLNTDHGPRTCS